MTFFESISLYIRSSPNTRNPNKPLVLKLFRRFIIVGLILSDFVKSLMDKRIRTN